MWEIHFHPFSWEKPFHGVDENLIHFSTLFQIIATPKIVLFSLDISISTCYDFWVEKLSQKCAIKGVNRMKDHSL